MASQYEEGELLELPLKFNDIVDVYYDKMRPPKSEGKKKFSCFCQDFKHQREFVSSKLGYWMMESEENLKKINYSVKFNVEIENIGKVRSHLTLSLNSNITHIVYFLNFNWQGYSGWPLLDICLTHFVQSKNKITTFSGYLQSVCGTVLAQ